MKNFKDMKDQAMAQAIGNVEEALAALPAISIPNQVSGYRSKGMSNPLDVAFCIAPTPEGWQALNNIAYAYLHATEGTYERDMIVHSDFEPGTLYFWLCFEDEDHIDAFLGLLADDTPCCGGITDDDDQ